MNKLCRDNHLIWPMEAGGGPNFSLINPTASHLFLVHLSLLGYVLPFPILPPPFCGKVTSRHHQALSGIASQNQAGSPGSLKEGVTLPKAHCRRIGANNLWMRLFGLQLEASCLQWSFFTYSRQFSFFTHSWSFFAYSFSFFTYSWSFFAYSGKVRLIRASRDCKQRSLTVSKKAPTVSKKASPIIFGPLLGKSLEPSTVSKLGALQRQVDKGNLQNQ